jgi:hypothetical protein
MNHVLEKQSKEKPGSEVLLGALALVKTLRDSDPGTTPELKEQWWQNFSNSSDDLSGLRQQIVQTVTEAMEVTREQAGNLSTITDSSEKIAPSPEPTSPEETTTTPKQIADNTATPGTSKRPKRKSYERAKGRISNTFNEKGEFDWEGLNKDDNQ